MSVFSVLTVDRVFTTTHLTMMTTSKTTRLQDNTNHKGLALCGHIILLVVTARWWVPVNTHGTPASNVREAVGSPKAPHATKSRRKTQLLSWSSIFSHDLGHLCRGRRIVISGHSDFRIFEQSWSVRFFCNRELEPNGQSVTKSEDVQYRKTHMQGLRTHGHICLYSCQSAR